MRREVLLSIILGGRCVRSAIDIEDFQALDPVTEEDPSPISDINTYYPDQHDCPLPCTDFANIHSWITYFSVERLRRCPKPMLLQLSVSQSLSDPDTTTLIRGCTLDNGAIAVPENLTAVENPKTQNTLALAKLESEATCVSSGIETGDKVQLFASGSEKEKEEDGRAAALIKGFQEFFKTHENCDEKFVFGYFNETVAAVYIGDRLGKGTVESSLQSLGENYPRGLFPPQAVVEVCHSNGTEPGQVFGMTFENTRNLASVQEAVLKWSNGECFSKEGLSSAVDLPGAKVLQIAMGENNTLSGNATHSHAVRHLDHRSAFGGHSLLRRHATQLDKRATCSYLTVTSEDTCPTLVRKCGVSNTDFVKFNPKSGLCGSLKKNDFVCCSAGDLPSASDLPPAGVPAPAPGADGVCATHLIQNGDTCTSLSKRYGVTVENIEIWNKKKTWAWTVCGDMLVGYNMCVSDGFAPMPPPQQGAECGPLVPGTPALTDRSKSLADVNPCPLKACCSNWGFCGVFEGHCAIHAPPDGGPGTKDKAYQNTCVSNCDNKLKAISSPPAKYQRIGYYESWNMNRDCLWLKAEDANTDGTYTHIHWSFAEIDPTTFKVIIKDEHKQWTAFKNLQNVKRIVSFGGWAYSTENPGASIIRSAIIGNRDLFATNLAEFAKAEGIDGIDIDWEYPGAPDIPVDGKVIGEQTDGINYLKFLSVLKTRMGIKTVSIAAPASYWYLKAFPIDRIASVIDYIVYMTYDLHGQWDYGNPNSFDSCDSGKCIRSHVNLTETDNALAMIIKAGVPNNKVFVGESSYGRSFRMAKPGCWSSMCEFTGSRSQSDAKPGRCTNTSGYIAQAEINELIQRGGMRSLFDPSSSSNVMLHDGDYISYLDEDSKLSRRERWKNLNFAGTIDWALDLQHFSNLDKEIPDRPKSGKGCVEGRDLTINTLDLCQFTCAYGFCPETFCECLEKDELENLPPDLGEADVEAWRPADVDLTRLCKFACKYGYCPEQVCTPFVPDDEEDEDGNVINEFNDGSQMSKRNLDAKACTLWRGNSPYDNSAEECKKVCKDQLDAAAAAGRTSNYGCQANIDVATGNITWLRRPNGYVTTGTCLCDNWLMNEVADTVLEAMPMIAQISCYVLMSSLKFVLDVGLEFVPVVGKALDAGLDMATTAAQMAAYLYPDEEDPEGAFDWWLKPCGGTTLVPSEIKQLFSTLSTVADGVSSFKKPKNLKKGSGKKGDDGNPKDRSAPGPSTGTKKTKAKCLIRKGQGSRKFGRGNVWQKQDCQNDHTHVTQYIVTSLVHVNNPQTTTISAECERKWEQACYHYSSAIDVNPAWATQHCHALAATTAYRPPSADLKATSTWSAERGGTGWQDAKYRVEQRCQRDEYPPAYFLYKGMHIMDKGGEASDAQLIRWLKGRWNGQAAEMWGGVCFIPSMNDWVEKDFTDAVAKDLAKVQQVTVQSTGKQNSITKTITEIQFSATAEKIPEFTITKWPTPPAGSDKGLKVNDCWPKQIAAQDPGFVLLNIDPYNANKAPQWDYKAAYKQGTNGD